MSLAADVLSGNRRALARALSVVEGKLDGCFEIMNTLYPHTGNAHIIGVTGAPGTGKSSIVNQLALALRKRGKTVGVVAVDPTSPFTGGAILGDRIRMRDLSGDAGVFIRSMATRGSLGGLAQATANVVRVLDAARFDVILIETVGAGQSEVDIARHALSVLVVEAPGLGDDVQAIKAGILEIADVLVVNKSDDPRASNTVRSLRAMLDLGNLRSVRQMVDHHGRLMEAIPAARELTAEADGWQVPIQQTVATNGTGIDDLVSLLDTHRVYLISSGELERRMQILAASELDTLLRESLIERLLNGVDQVQLAELVERVVTRDLAPQAAVDLLLENRL
jgi:LAO/AO transport system kinase